MQTNAGLLGMRLYEMLTVGIVGMESLKGNV